MAWTTQCYNPKNKNVCTYQSSVSNNLSDCCLWPHLTVSQAELCTACRDVRGLAADSVVEGCLPQYLASGIGSLVEEEWKLNLQLCSVPSSRIWEALLLLCIRLHVVVLRYSGTVKCSFVYQVSKTVHASVFQGLCMHKSLDHVFFVNADCVYLLKISGGLLWLIVAITYAYSLLIQIMFVFSLLCLSYKHKLYRMIK
jgi:hypothetical protein